MDDLLELHARLQKVLPRYRIGLITDHPLAPDQVKVGRDIRVYPTMVERLEGEWLARLRAFRVVHAGGFEATARGIEATIDLVRRLSEGQAVPRRPPEAHPD